MVFELVDLDVELAAKVVLDSVVLLEVVEVLSVVVAMLVFFTVELLETLDRVVVVNVLSHSSGCKKYHIPTNSAASFVGKAPKSKFSTSSSAIRVTGSQLSRVQVVTVVAVPVTLQPTNSLVMVVQDVEVLHVAHSTLVMIAVLVRVQDALLVVGGSVMVLVLVGSVVDGSVLVGSLGVSSLGLSPRTGFSGQDPIVVPKI